MPPPSPCPAHPLALDTLVSHPSVLSCPLLGSCKSWTHPFVLFLHEEKKPVFSRMFKKSFQTHTVLIQKKKKKTNHTIVTKVAYIQTKSSPWLSTGGTWCALHLHTPEDIQDSVSQICDINPWGVCVQEVLSSNADHLIGEGTLWPAITSLSRGCCVGSVGGMGAVQEKELEDKEHSPQPILLSN